MKKSENKKEIIYHNQQVLIVKSMKNAIIKVKNNNLIINAEEIDFGDEDYQRMGRAKLFVDKK